MENRESGLTQKELTILMASDPNTITSILNRMEGMRCIARTPHGRDRRANCIRITTRGARLYSRGRVLAVDLQERALSAIPAKKREQFLRHLEAVARAVEEGES
jgi:DNA-binding MarR family transcriptional regulator